MTTQTAVFGGLPTGLTLTAKLFTLATPDTVAFTADSVTERTNAKCEYVASFGEAAVISGDHTIILFVGSTPVGIGKRTFAGTDAEVATVTPEVAVLDTAARVKLDADQPDYDPLKAPELRGDLTFAEAVDLILAGVLGVSSQPDAATELFKFVDAADAFVTTFDTAGNRTAVVLQ